MDIRLVERAIAARGSMPENTTAGRRNFLESAAGATAALILEPRTVFGSQANSAVEVGLVGCGNRGSWIAPFFPEYTGARIVALADVVREKLDGLRENLKIDASRAYHGPDAYRELANSKLDAVVTVSSTGARWCPSFGKAASTGCFRWNAARRSRLFAAWCTFVRCWTSARPLCPRETREKG